MGQSELNEMRRRGLPESVVANWRSDAMGGDLAERAISQQEAPGSRPSGVSLLAYLLGVGGYR